MSASAAAVRLVALLSACFIATHARVDPDLWGHLRFGLDTFVSGRLSITDSYSFTQDVPWINHEWLSEVAMAIAWRAGGVLGIVLLKAVLLAGAFALLATVTRQIDEPRRWWLLAAGVIAVAPAAFTLRPQIWTLLAIPLLWHALNRRRWLPAIPLLFAVWANLHGGWIVGAGAGALWIAGRAIDRRSVRATLGEALALAAGLAATSLNPYGWRLWWFLLTTVRPARAISEWRPVWQQDDATSALIWALVAGVIVAPTIARRRPAIDWAGALPAAWLGVMSLFVARLVPLFGEVALLGAARAWSGSTTIESEAQRFLNAEAPAKAVGAPIASPKAGAATPHRIVDAAVFAAICLANLVPEARCLPIGRGNWTPDLRAAAALASPSAQGRLVLPFNWGEYAIWHFGPRLRVSIDGRRETVYSDRVVDIQSAAAHGLPEGLEYLQQTRPEYVWLPSDTGARTASWLKTNGYRVDIDTGASFIATRADRPPLAVAAPMPSCFP